METEVLVDDRKIWWIASYPKSGNTWIRMFMNAYLSGFPVDINTAFQYALGDQNTAIYQACYTRPVIDLAPIEQAMIRPAALMAAISLSSNKDVCLKTHHAKVRVEDIPMIPARVSAGGVYIIRDPRDIVLSFADHIGNTVDEAIECMDNPQYAMLHRSSRLLHFLLTWSSHVESWTLKNTDVPMTVVKYEDMLEHTDGAFKAILDGLGHGKNINNRRFKFALEQTRFSNLQKLEKKKKFREAGQGGKFFRVGKAGQWKTALTESQVARIEAAHRTIMVKFGYTLQGALAEAV